MEKAQLGPVPAGTVTLSRDGRSGLVTGAFDVYGLALRSAHGVTLRSGTCDSPGTDTIAVFADLKADTYGAAKAKVTSAEAVSSIPVGAHVDVELGPAATASSAPGSTRVACADITASPGSPLPLKPFPGQKPGGTVTLTYSSSGRLDIHVVASGLTPSSPHAGHVHFGSCRQQSGVLYTIGDVISDAQGSIDSTITLTGVATAPPQQGWYADLHLGPVSGLEAGGEATLLFQPVLCGDGSR